MGPASLVALPNPVLTPQLEIKGSFLTEVSSIKLSKSPKFIKIRRWTSVSSHTSLLSKAPKPLKKVMGCSVSLNTWCGFDYIYTMRVNVQEIKLSGGAVRSCFRAPTRRVLLRQWPRTCRWGVGKYSKEKSGAEAKSVTLHDCEFLFLSFKLVMLGFMSLLIPE